MLGEKLKEYLFVLLPPESVFGVAYLESFKMQLSEQALVGIAILLAEYGRGPIAFVATSLNQSIAAKERKSGRSDGGFFSERREAHSAQTVSKIELNLFSP